MTLMSEKGATASSCIRALELLCAVAAEDAALVGDPRRLRSSCAACVHLAAKLEGIRSVPLSVLAESAGVDAPSAILAAEPAVIGAVDGAFAAPTGWTKLERIALEWRPRPLAFTAAQALLCLLAVAELERYLAAPDLAALGAALAAAAAFGQPLPAGSHEPNTEAAAPYAAAALRAARAAQVPESPESVVAVRPDYQHALAALAAKSPPTVAAAALEHASFPSPPLPAHALLRRFLPAERRERTAPVTGGMRITAKLGEGVYGKVYRVRLRDASRGVIAVKELPGQDGGAGGLVPSSAAELAIHRAVAGGPGVVDMLWWRVTPQYVFIALPAFPTTLLGWLTNNKAAESQALSFLRQLCSALDHVHSCGVLHLDVKPSNILIDPASMDVRVCDFSVSETWDVGGERMCEGPLVQSVWYRAPEVVARCDRRVPALDVWSLGIVGVDIAANMAGVGMLDAGFPLRGPWCDSTGEEQLQAVFESFGFPRRGGGGARWWPELATTRYYRETIRHWERPPGKPLEALLPGAPGWLLAFLGRALLYRPQSRPSCGELLLALPPEVHPEEAHREPKRRKRQCIEGARASRQKQ